MVAARRELSASPSLLSLAQRGVTVTENEKVARHCRLLFLTCLPAHVSTVAAATRGKLKSSTIVCSVVAGVNVEKLAKLFQTEVVLRTCVCEEWLHMSDGERLFDVSNLYWALESSAVLHCR